MQPNRTARKKSSKPKHQVLIDSRLGSKAKNIETLIPIIYASLRMNIYQGVANVVLLISFIVLCFSYINKPVVTKYLAHDRAGNITGEILIQDEPLRIDARVTSLIDNCIHRTFNLDHKHWRTQLTASSDCFTKKGFEELVSSIDRQDITRDIERVRGVSAVSSTTPLRVINRTTNYRGDEEWRVKGSYLFTIFNGGTGKDAKRLDFVFNVDVAVREVPLSVSTRGLSIFRTIINTKPA